MTNDQEIKAFYDLCQAKARYCRTLDTRDWSGFADLFTEDIELDVSDGNTGVEPITGRDKAVEFIRASLANTKTAHQVHMPEIDLSGDEARVVWAMHDRVVWQPNGPALTGYGHYHERWRRQNGKWKIAALKLTRLHMDIQPAQD
jgi:SnoaL-like domain